MGQRNTGSKIALGVGVNAIVSVMIVLLFATFLLPPLLQQYAKNGADTTYYETNNSFTTGELEFEFIATLYVSPLGDDSDGLTWETAFKTINKANTVLIANNSHIALIYLSPGIHDVEVATHLSLAGNAFFVGSDSTTIQNSHARATAILNTSFYLGMKHIFVDLLAGTDGIVLNSADHVELMDLYVEGENITSAAAGIVAISSEYLNLNDIMFHGGSTLLTAIVMNGSHHGNIENLVVQESFIGLNLSRAWGNQINEIQINLGSTGIFEDNFSYSNSFFDLRFVNLHENVNSNSSTSYYDRGSIDSNTLYTKVYPNSTVGINVTGGSNADAYGNWTVVMPAYTATNSCFAVLGFEAGGYSDATTQMWGIEVAVGSTATPIYAGLFGPTYGIAVSFNIEAEFAPRGKPVYLRLRTANGGSDSALFSTSYTEL